MNDITPELVAQFPSLQPAYEKLLKAQIDYNTQYTKAQTQELRRQLAGEDEAAAAKPLEEELAEEQF